MCLNLAIAGGAAKADAPLIFQQGINLYEQGQWDQSKEKFSQLSSDPRWAFAALYNLGNIAVRQKHGGEALGYYRRALHRNPHDRDLLFNLKFVMESFSIGRAFGTPTYYETLRADFLDRFTFNEIATAALLSSVFFLFFLFKFLKNKKQAAPPPFSAMIAGALLFLVGVTAMSLKAFDSYTERATIVVNKAPLRSGPGASNASMQEITEGTEVLVQDSANSNGSSWRQVTIPGGLTGWVQETDLMITSGGGPW